MSVGARPEEAQMREVRKVVPSCCLLRKAREAAQGRSKAQLERQKVFLKLGRKVAMFKWNATAILDIDTAPRVISFEVSTRKRDAYDAVERAEIHCERNERAPHGNYVISKIDLVQS
jgi:hypothetical protein